MEAILQLIAHVLAIVRGLLLVNASILPSKSWGYRGLPRKSLLCHEFEVYIQEPCLWLLPTLAACKAFVNAICKVDGLRNSHIWEFSVTALSNLECKSLIWEDWALIFLSHLHWDLDTIPSSSDSIPAEDTKTTLVEVLTAECWCVPRILASSLQNWVKETYGICINRVFAIDVLLRSYSWLAHCCFKVASKLRQKLGFLPITLWARSWSSAAKASSDSLAFWLQL